MKKLRIPLPIILFATVFVLSANYIAMVSTLSSEAWSQATSRTKYAVKLMVEAWDDFMYEWKNGLCYGRTCRSPHSSTKRRKNYDQSSETSLEDRKRDDDYHKPQDNETLEDSHEVDAFANQDDSELSIVALQAFIYFLNNTSCDKGEEDVIRYQTFLAAYNEEVDDSIKESINGQHDVLAYMSNLAQEDLNKCQESCVSKS